MPSPTPTDPEDAAMHAAMQRALRTLLSPLALVPAYPVAFSSLTRRESSARPASAGRASFHSDAVGVHAVQSGPDLPPGPAVRCERRNEPSQGHPLRG